MIISDVKSGHSNRNKRSFILFGGALFVLLVVFLFLRSLRAPENIPDVFFCDAEHIKEDLFVGQGMDFTGAVTQSNEYAFSGSYASKTPVSEQAQYGFGCVLKEFSGGATYRASVWRFRPQGGKGTLVISGDGEGQFYKGVDIPVANKNGWERLELTFRVPLFRVPDKINIYVFSDGKYELFFDDLKVVRISDSTAEAEGVDVEVLELTIEDKGMRKLKRKRAEALRVGILETGDDDWVKGKLKETGSDEPIKVDVRLKGDWLDHLEGEKWSFRIKTKNGKVWNRMRAFSLHTPKARAFLHEWVLHKLWEREDVLTTRYDFVLLKLNGKDLGVYAFEEHFDKILVERQKRREGPIIRFSEDGFWVGIKRHLQSTQDVDHGLEQPVKQMEASEINMFQEKNVLRSPVLRKQFEIAQNLLYQYKYGARKAEDIFDIEQMARYYAICDVLDAYHGTAWHNQRFYYNPVISKLEPVGFDGYGESVNHRNNFLGAGAFNTKQWKDGKAENLLFLNRDFTARYAYYLARYSTRTFIQGFLADIEEALNARENLIRMEFPDYRFSREDLIIYATRMRNIVLPFSNHSLKAYTEDKSAEGKNLSVAGFHGLPLEIIGAGPSGELMADTFGQTFLLEAFRPRRIQDMFKEEKDSVITVDNGNIWKAYSEQLPVRYSSINVRNSDKYLFFRVLGVDSVFCSKILDWPGPKIISPPQDLGSKVELRQNGLYEIEGNRIYFRKGKHRVVEDIIIPRGHEVTFYEGVSLDFVNRSKFISYSPVFMYGTKEAPIKIYSSDGTGNGFSVLQAGRESALEFVIFDNMNTLDYKNWTLTGSVTFYESDVDIDQCVFRNALCEDALNIIRSEFALNNSFFSSTYSDALDADFSKGYINNTRFQDMGNDAMDFSGSNILIEQCEVYNAGDKGVSVGEDTDASIFSMDINNSNIGVAAKDLSVLTIKKIGLSDCKQGFAAYQKKPEYGGSTIFVEEYTAENVQRLYNIRVNSVLQLKDKIIKGE